MDLQDIFQLAVKQKASDVHLLVGKPPVFRVDGVLHEVKGQSALDESAMEKLVYKLLEPHQKERFLRERELDISFELADKTRFRINCHFERNHVGLSARIVPARIPTMEEIGASEIIYKLVRLKQGLVLVTGPTGHGKSTTLAAMINLINSERSEHIVTLEDPIEFIFKPKQSIIRQRQLGTDMLSFAAGLRHVLRQDPDVIMVGEMRDLETIATALTLALNFMQHPVDPEDRWLAHQQMHVRGFLLDG